MKQAKEPCVVYIITQLELGGAQKICLSLFNNLSPHQITTKLISSAQGVLVNQVKDSPNALLLPTLQRSVTLSGIWYELKTFFSMIRKLRRLKKEYPHIIVHTHSTKAGILGRWAAFFAGIKTRIHTIHGYAFHKHQSWIKWLIIYSIELITSLITTHFICVSSEDVKTGITLFPFFAKKHSIIRAAVDWQQFYIPARIAENFPIQNELFIFGTVSCFKPQKNLFDLLHSFEYVHLYNPDTRLEIIGDGAQRNQIEEWIIDHGLGYAITLHGWQDKVAPLMIHWHAFVLSSLWEGLPCAIVEARLLKLPVLSYKTGGIGDVIFSGENGMLYSQGNWKALAQGMLELSTNKELYKKLQTHHDDLHDFNNERMVQQHIKLYSQFL